MPWLPRLVLELSQTISGTVGGCFEVLKPFLGLFFWAVLGLLPDHSGTVFSFGAPKPFPRLSLVCFWRLFWGSQAISGLADHFWDCFWWQFWRLFWASPDRFRTVFWLFGASSPKPFRCCLFPGYWVPGCFWAGRDLETSPVCLNKNNEQTNLHVRL